jgi:hypothetical protein
MSECFECAKSLNVPENRGRGALRPSCRRQRGQMAPLMPAQPIIARILGFSLGRFSRRLATLMVIEGGNVGFRGDACRP